MRKHKTRYLSILTLVPLLASVAFAQSAVNSAAQSAAAAAQNAAVSARQSAAAASQAARASAQSAATHGAQVSAIHSPAVTGATSTAVSATTAAGAPIPQTKGTLNAGLATSASAQPGHGAGKDVGADASASGNGTAHAPGLTNNGMASGQIAMSLNATQISSEVRSATPATRETVFMQIDSNIDSTDRALANLSLAARDLPTAARVRFDTAYQQVRVSEETVRRSLVEARHASPERTADAQARLASDYEAYADAVAAAEAAAHGSLSTSGSLNR